MRHPAVAIGFLLTLSAVLAPPADAGGAKPLRVGMVKTFFHDMKDALIKDVTEPFVGVMRETAGLTGKLVVAGDPMTLAEQLHAGKYDIGIFHGFEFAWAQQKYPELTAGMIAVNAKHPTRAYVLVPKDGGAATFADLKGKTLGIPDRTKEPPRYFLGQLLRKAGSPSAKDFFGSVTKPDNVEAGLDDLRDGKKLQAVIVDENGLEFYKDLKPGAFARLKVLAKSDVYPPVVVAYREGTLNAATLTNLRDGLKKAQTVEQGRDLMKTWKITSFEPVPADFRKTLAASLRSFPLPDGKK